MITWYDRAKHDNLEVDAGMKEGLLSALLGAMMMVGGGMALDEAAHRSNVNKDLLESALHDRKMLAEMEKRHETEENKGKRKDEWNRFLQMDKNLMERMMQSPGSMNLNTPSGTTSPSVQHGNYLPAAASMIKRHEGVRHGVYRDSEGVPTIGIGFNLTRPDAPDILKSVGADYRSVMNGRKLNDRQIESIFRKCLDKAEKDVRTLLPSFDSQNDKVKIILVDMSFNLGEKLSGFSNMLQSLEKKDYATAATEMMNSKWYQQVGNRGKFLTNLMMGES